MTASIDAVLFISFGGPEKSDDIMPFLEIVTQGRGIPRERLLGVAQHYEEMGGRSPINEITRRQADGMRRELKAQGCELPVYIGQRNWHPFLKDTLAQMAKDGVKNAIGFITAAHRCEASLERYVKAVEKARQEIGPAAPAIHYVNPWFDHPLFVESICHRINEVLPPSPSPLPPGPSVRCVPGPMAPPQAEAKVAGEGARSAGEAAWYFTAHSIPCSMAKESPYVQDLQRTAELVAKKFGKSHWKLGYSSRSGRPQDLWLEPDVNKAIIEESSRGTKKILFIPIGFLADHVEILYDLDHEAQATARAHGVELVRTQSVGDHPAFCRMMASVVLERLKGADAETQISSKTSCFSGCFCFPESKNPPCIAPSPSPLPQGEGPTKPGVRT